jgi:hypothetical protein
MQWFANDAALAAEPLTVAAATTKRDLGVFALFLALVCLPGCRQPAMAVPDLRITSDEYGYHMPDSVPAGLVHITLRNAGRDIHEALLVQFTDTIGTAAAYADSVRAHVDFRATPEMSVARRSLCRVIRAACGSRWLLAATRSSAGRATTSLAEWCTTFGSCRRTAPRVTHPERHVS